MKREPLSDSQHPVFLRWLRIEPKTKPAVYSQVFATTEIGSLTYWLEIFLSAGIATFGLVLNSPAVIIGAMLISPLMGPIMATGLALTVGDLYLGAKAVVNLLASVSVSVAFSGLLVWLLPFHSVTSEILARTNPNLLDLGVALFSGLAGSVVVSRSGGGGGGATALPGVAIAVALMPPLCTMGFGLGSGLNLTIMGGAGLLFLTNLVAIVASAFVVFVLVGMNSADVLAQADTARANDQIGWTVLHGPLGRLFKAGGRLRWRIVMIVVVLGSLAVPLREALLQVAGEAVARGLVQSEVRRLISTDMIVSQQVRIDTTRITIRLISTQPVPAGKIDEVRRSIERRSGRTVDLSIDAVASKSELAEALDRMRTPSTAVPETRTLDQLQRRLADLIQPALQEIWPVNDAPLQSVSVGLGTDGIALNIRYQAAVDLEEVTTQVILKALRAKLATPSLSLNLQRVSAIPSKATPKTKTKRR